jgi:predicted RNA binding protein YcfA (HicA-like mRNA interferase family)
MPRITPISWKKFEKIILYVGCKFDRQIGDHLIYNRYDLKRPVVFPKDNEIPIFIIRNNLRVLNITPEEYLEILKRI